MMSDSIPGYAEVLLSHGKVALVDHEDFARVSAYNWTTAPRKDGKWYAKCHIKYGTLYLHRFILNAPEHLQVDHKNGNSLDCRRHNLRTATPQQNQQNLPRPRTNTTGFKGVRAKGHRWYAHITHGQVQICLGGHSSAEDAARAYDKKAKELFGEFARLNFKSEV